MMRDNVAVSKSRRLRFGMECLSDIKVIYDITLVDRQFIDRMQRELAKALAAPDVREKLALLGAEPVGGKPNQLDAMRRAEIERWAGVIKREVIKLD